MKPINVAKHIAFLIWTLHMATGSDVVLGVLGMPAFIECQLAVSETLVWQIQFGPIIAMNGKVLNENTTKYVVQKQTGFREILVIHDVSLDDDRIYQCQEITNRSAIDATKLNVLGKLW
ncbi:hypothetical protein DPMN_084234 [Dreissena polymorpha]|uniref:Immunoglobulin V-set domain-containing protein n=1 Tax=Dreissena polymorpha TaxID=45954 RepID=A0A9D4BKN6_DREPO|nr:hypothetical protein DPMN_084234 [Dreissena polymorpha]